jgi:hypothetical protein
MDCGSLLIEAKARVSHGEWLPWLEKECHGISDRTARIYMQLSKHRPEIEAKIGNIANLTLTEALKLIRQDDATKPKLVVLNDHRPPQRSHTTIRNVEYVSRPAEPIRLSGAQYTSKPVETIRLSGTPYTGRPVETIRLPEAPKPEPEPEPVSQSVRSARDDFYFFSETWKEMTDEDRACFVRIAWLEPTFQSFYRACLAYDEEAVKLGQGGAS